MFEWLFALPIFWATFLVGALCWFCTSLGALTVIFFKGLSQKWVSALLSFAAGIMVASSFFSLLLPALEYCQGETWKEILFVVLGFLLGAVFIVLTNLLFDKKFVTNEFLASKTRKSALITTSITMHNIPEGMAVGVAVGGALIAGDAVLLFSALALAVGVAIQNIPEGASVALALKCQGESTKKSFFVGVMSGVVEPIFAGIASVIVVYVLGVLPALLAFSAGAMMIVAITELIPEATENNKAIAVWCLALGFSIMALLDVAL